MGDTSTAAVTNNEEGPKQNWKTSKNYYYWHGHGKDRAEEGDVAPMPTHVLLHTDEATPSLPTPPQMVKKYSWCDGEKSVSVYVETVEAEGDSVHTESISVEWKQRSVRILFSVNTASNVRRERQLHLHLAHEVIPGSCTHRVKDATQQIILKAVKSEVLSWHELTGKEVVEKDDDE